MTNDEFREAALSGNLHKTHTLKDGRWVPNIRDDIFFFPHYDPRRELRTQGIYGFDVAGLPIRRVEMTYFQDLGNSIKSKIMEMKREMDTQGHPQDGRVVRMTERTAKVLLKLGVDETLRAGSYVGFDVELNEDMRDFDLNFLRKIPVEEYRYEQGARVHVG